MLALLLACAPEPDDPERGHPGDGNGPRRDETDADADADTDADTDVEPALGETSGGSGGGDHPTSTSLTAGSASYLLLAPSGTASARGVPFLVVISGTEGASAMMSNMRQVAPYYGLDDALIAVLDGTRASAADGAAVIDAVREAYDVDNDRTWLLSESAGTRAGLELAFHERPTYFAAYWANDVNDRDTPSRTADELGFVPSGNAGPGGDLPDANAIVDGMRDAGWDLPADAPYSGAGSTQHGSTEQFLAAVDFFADKRR
ncbi:MAG: hypothetical protein ACOZNI_17335 [Myxococcota bacterium]